MLYFGLIDHGSERSIYYHGEMESGAIFKIEFKDSASGKLTFTNTVTRSTFSIDLDKVGTIIDSTIQGGDIIIVNTKRGTKSVTFERSGVETNILGAFSRGSDWIQLSPGKNTFSYSIEQGVENAEFTVIANVVYGGI